MVQLTIRVPGLVSAAALVFGSLAFQGVAIAQAPRPDAMTMNVSGTVELCRPPGRCFPLESNLPIFFRDEIDTYLPGRVEFSVSGVRASTAGFVALTPSGHIRIGRGDGELIEIELTRGLVIVEAVGEIPLEIRFGDTLCAIKRGSVAIGYNEVDGKPENAYVANRNANSGCLARSGHHVIERGSVGFFISSQLAKTTALTDSFWGNLREQR